MPGMLSNTAVNQETFIVATTTVRSSPFLIGVAGGTSSGKSTVCERIWQQLGDERKPSLITIGQDAFYRELNDEEKAQASAGDFNFDHPDALDFDMMLDTLRNLKEGRPATIYSYDFRTHSRQGSPSKVGPADVVLVEGILIFYNDTIRNLFDMKLFVDTDPDMRLAKRVLRDIKDRGRNLEHILHQYLDFVKPAYEEFCMPTKKYADVIIPRGAENQVAIELIVQHIQELLRSPRDQSGQQQFQQQQSPALRTRYRVQSDSTMLHSSRLH